MFITGNLTLGYKSKSVFMFMFQNGLLATFIPEILMVFGFLLCLFAAAFKPAELAASRPTLAVANVITIELQKQNASYQVSVDDYQIVETDSSNRHLNIPKVEISIKIPSKLNFPLSDGLSFVGFSRPPPSLS